MAKLPSFSLALHLFLVTTGAIIAEGVELCSTDPSITAKCFSQDSPFAENGCRCCDGSARPDDCDLSGLVIQCLNGGFEEGFPVITNETGLALLKEVTCLIMERTRFTTLQPHHMRQFPNLTHLFLTNGRLSTIEDGTFDSIRIDDLSLAGNRLRTIPPVQEQYELLFLDVSRNKIRSLVSGDLRGCFKLGTLYLHYNDLRELRGGVFSDNCRLQRLTLGHNRRLKDLDSDVFVPTALRILDMSDTSITKVPYEGIRDTLVGLFLGETRDLTRYSAYRGSSDDVYGGRTFPLLQEVEFYYSAHCCQMRDHTYALGNRPGRRSVASQADLQITELVLPFRQTREAGNTSLGSGDTPIEATSCYSPEAFPSVLEIEICPSSAGASLDPSPSSAGASLDSSTSLAGASLDPSPSSAGMSLDPSPSSAGVSLDPSPSLAGASLDPSPSSADVSLDPSPSSADASLDASPSSAGASLVPSPSSAGASLFPSPSSTPYSCSVEQRRVSCRSRVPTASPTVSTPSPTPTPVTPTCPDVCDRDYCECKPGGFCEYCKGASHSECTSSSCPFLYSGICDCSRKRSVPSESYARDQFPDMQRQSRSSDNCEIPDGYFLPPNSNSTDVICSLVPDSPTPTPSVSVIPPTVVPFVTPSCSPLGRTDLNHRYETGLLTSCSPDPDAFNPCEDLLGDNDVGGTFLRIGIWVVIVLAIFGNGIVIFVIVGHSFVLRRGKDETVLMHFLYVNLACADFIMGVYLFTLAVVDLDTLGHYAEDAIEWQNGHGCGFAGFCAILSTVVSVYTLTVITLERVYTIVNVFQRRKMYKIVFFVIMGAGWTLGVIMGMLPLVGVNSYSVVAICLPFDVSDIPGKMYAAFLLLATGLVFVAIAVSYCVIFYQVFCGRSKRRLHNSTSDRLKWKTEIKVGLRMSLLVFTNFVCWFPIALLGLTAAFGESLVDVPTSKFFLVFFFPINACVNPVLYSLSTRTFRQNFCLLLGRFGLFKGYNRRLRSLRAGMYTPSATSDSVPPGGRRGTIMQRLLSISSIRTISISERRGSAMSQGSFDEQGRYTSRRASSFSAGSDDQLLNVRNPYSRRSSNFSGSSSEDTTTLNSSNRSCSPQPHPLVVETSPGVVVGLNVVKPKLAGKSSTSSLGAVPEEIEIAPTPTPDHTKLNPAYQEEEEEEEEGYCSERKDSDQPSELADSNGAVILQHHIVSETLPDSGQVSESPSIEEGVEMSVLNMDLRKEGDTTAEDQEKSAKASKSSSSAGDYPITDA